MSLVEHRPLDQVLLYGHIGERDECEVVGDPRAQSLSADYLVAILDADAPPAFQIVTRLDGDHLSLSQPMLSSPTGHDPNGAFVNVQEMAHAMSHSVPEIVALTPEWPSSQHIQPHPADTLWKCHTGAVDVALEHEGEHPLEELVVLRLHGLCVSMANSTSYISSPIPVLPPGVYQVVRVAMNGFLAPERVVGMVVVRLGGVLLAGRDGLEGGRDVQTELGSKID